MATPGAGEAGTAARGAGIAVMVADTAAPTGKLQNPPMV